MKTAAEWRADPPTTTRTTGWDKKTPLSEADKRFFALREAGWKGWIDQDGTPWSQEEHEAWRQERQTEADQAQAKFTPPPAAEPWSAKGTGKDVKSPLAAAATGGATTSGGSGMSAVSEAKGLLAQAGEHVDTAMATNQETIAQLEQAQQTVLSAIEESSQAASDEAQALIQRALEAANELTQLLGAIPQSLESIQL